MTNKKNLWFLTLFSLVLVLSVYYITMPKELLLSNNSLEIDDNVVTSVEEIGIIETLRQEDNSHTIEEINKLKSTISDNSITPETKNEAFDALKLINQISSKEELLEEKIKIAHGIDSFVKIDGDQIRVVVNSTTPGTTLANDIMRTVQSNFENKQYIVVQFK